MMQLPPEGPRSTYVRLWLDHPGGRIPLQQAGGGFVIAREDLPALEAATVVTEVDGVEHSHRVRVPAPAKAGQPANVESLAEATLVRTG